MNYSLPHNAGNPGSFRNRMAVFLEGNGFLKFITTLIVLNAAILGLETDPEIHDSYGFWLNALDKAILIVFTIELTLKFLTYRLNFFRSGWNFFDLAIVAISWAPATGALSVLRALRIIRVLRLLSVIPEMRRVVSALGNSVPGMSSVAGVLMLVFYIASVLATKLFGAHPDPQMQEWFGSISASAFTLFQVMTLESWSMGVARPTMALFPWAWAFFVPFIMITTFSVLNLFIGIIVDAMSSVQNDSNEQEASEIKDFTHQEIKALHAKLDALHQELARLRPSGR